MSDFRTLSRLIVGISVVLSRVLISCDITGLPQNSLYLMALECTGGYRICQLTMIRRHFESSTPLFWLEYDRPMAIGYSGGTQKALESMRYFTGGF